MTIDEAIEQYKHIADSYESVGNTKDAMETRQIAEWLRRARGANKAARWYTEKIKQLHEENAKLREQVTQLQDDWESERDYADQMEANEKKAVGENANLRKLVAGLTWCCEHYSCRQECPLYDVSEPDHCREVSIKRELGIEVD